MGIFGNLVQNRRTSKLKMMKKISKVFLVMVLINFALSQTAGNVCTWNSDCPSGQECYYPSANASSGCCYSSPPRTIGECEGLPDECEDLKPKKWCKKKKKLCKKSFISKQCKKTCGKCDDEPPKPENCKDKKPKKFCSKQKKANKCSIKKNKKNCKKTCGHCIVPVSLLM